MTPQLQQAIRLLQLSAIELQAEIQEALESNPLLENGDDIDRESDDTATAEAQESSDATNPADESTEERSESDLDSATDSEETVSQNEWDEHYDVAIAPKVSQGSGDGAYEFESYTSAPQTLRDHLYWQMRMTPFSDIDMTIAHALIDAIDDHGYISCSLDDIRESLTPDHEVELDEVEAVLHQIQNFDPIGVAARDVGECLTLQLRQLPEDTPARANALELVAKHLHLLGARDYTQLRRGMKISADDLQQAVTLIQALDPRPGNRIQPVQPSYVVPDVVLRKIKGLWHVELNANAFPRVGINPGYAGLLKRNGSGKDHKYLQDNLQEARWFIKSLQNRQDTLLKVAREIVKRQREFFELGDEAMKPMVLHDIAEALGMHESTISRVTTQKYMLTPRGIFELKYFFSSHVNTADGGTRSATAIRSLIKKFIDKETPTKPISDSKIAQLLEDQGINVARRTIAKYREHMNIPPSNQRKSLG